MPGFLHHFEIKTARSLLERKYRREVGKLPSREQLEQQATAIVEEAHRITRQSGQRLVGILRDLVDDLKKG